MAGDITSRARHGLISGPAARARARRHDLLVETFPEIRSMRVLDLGGRPETWAVVRPAEVTVVNLVPAEIAGQAEHVVPVVGNACDPRLLAGERFDLVYSNSVLEHVGGHAARLAMAGNVHRFAARHWVQTPYRYFPVEPHWLCPGMQWLPAAGRVKVAQVWPLGHAGRADDRETAMSAVLGTELVGLTEMRHYFPGSRILTERYAGLVKSLTAVAA